MKYMNAVGGIKWSKANGNTNLVAEFLLFTFVAVICLLLYHKCFFSIIFCRLLYKTQPRCRRCFCRSRRRSRSHRNRCCWCMPCDDDYGRIRCCRRSRSTHYRMGSIQCRRCHHYHYYYYQHSIVANVYRFSVEFCYFTYKVARAGRRSSKSYQIVTLYRINCVENCNNNNKNKSNKTY